MSAKRTKQCQRVACSVVGRAHPLAAPDLDQEAVAAIVVQRGDAALHAHPEHLQGAREALEALRGLVQQLRGVRHQRLQLGEEEIAVVIARVEGRAGGVGGGGGSGRRGDERRLTDDAEHVVKSHGDALYHIGLIHKVHIVTRAEGFDISRGAGFGVAQASAEKLVCPEPRQILIGLRIEKAFDEQRLPAAVLGAEGALRELRDVLPVDRLLALHRRVTQLTNIVN